MQSSTTIIHRYNILSLKATRITLFIVGFLMLILLVTHFATNNSANTPPSLYWGLVLMGTAVLGLSEKSPFSPKVKITPDYILLKNGFWSGSTKLAWSEINRIELQSYKIIFNLSSSDFIFKYDSDSAVSVKIKVELRKACTETNTPITGG